MSTLHVWAVGDARCPYLDATGRPIAGRYAGRDRRTHAALPEGEPVTDHHDYQRAVARGSLSLSAPAAPKAPAKPATPKGTDQ